MKPCTMEMRPMVVNNPRPSIAYSGPYTVGISSPIRTISQYCEISPFPSVYFCSFQRSHVRPVTISFETNSVLLPIRSACHQLEDSWFVILPPNPPSILQKPLALLTRNIAQRSTEKLTRPTPERGGTFSGWSYRFANVDQKTLQSLAWAKVLGNQTPVIFSRQNLYLDPTTVTRCQGIPKDPISRPNIPR